MATREQWLRDAQKVGEDLKRLHDEALELNDAHEARHLMAALRAGSSDHCKEGLECVLDAPKPGDAVAQLKDFCAEPENRKSA